MFTKKKYFNIDYRKIRVCVYIFTSIFMQITTKL